MRKFIVPLLACAALAAPLSAAAQSKGGLSPSQLSSQGWTCFNAPGLGVHCAPPGKWPPTDAEVQLLYFFHTTDPNSTTPDFTGTETLLRDDVFHNQPCPTEPSGQYTFLGDLGLGGAEYHACHRQEP